MILCHTSKQCKGPVPCHQGSSVFSKPDCSSRRGRALCHLLQLIRWKVGREGPYLLYMRDLGVVPSGRDKSGPYVIGNTLLFFLCILLFLMMLRTRKCPGMRNVLRENVGTRFIASAGYRSTNRAFEAEWPLFPSPLMNTLESVPQGTAPTRFSGSDESISQIAHRIPKIHSLWIICPHPPDLST